MLVLAVMIFTVLFGLLSGVFMGYSLGYVNLEDIIFYLRIAGQSSYSKTILFLVSVLVFLLWIYFLERLLFKKQKEKTIAFDTPGGRVMVSLSAVEDFLKKTCEGMPEIREMKPQIIASHKGISVSLRLVLNPLQDLPQFSLNLQNLIKEKLSSLLGLEEEVNVRILVTKIVHPQERKRKERTERTREPKDSGPDSDIPYRNY